MSAAPYTFVSTIARQCSGVDSRKPRGAPKPAFANTTSMLPEPLERGGDHLLLVVPLRDVAAHGQRVELLCQRLKLVLGACREHQR